MRYTRLLVVGVIIAVVALPFTLPVNAGLANALSDNLRAYWKLDETSGTRYDSVSANDLSDSNTVTQNTGMLAYAAQFTAANNEYLIRGDNATLSTGDVDFTIAFWVRLDSKATLQNFVSKTGSNDREYTVYYYPSSDRFEGIVSSTGNTWDGAAIQANNLGSPAIGVWYFIVFWHDSILDTVNIQVNNGAVNSANWVSGVRDGVASFVLGADNGGVGGYLNGRIDGVGWWKSTPGGGGVLTQAQRDMLWNNGAGCDYPFAACEATHTPTVTNTFTPSNTATQTYTPSNTATNTDTPTNTFTPSNTPTSTFTPSDTPTITLTPSLTFTPSDTATSTATNTAPATSTPTPSATASNTPLPCATANEFESSVELTSGDCLIVERRWGYGEAFVGVAVIALAGVFGLRWIYDMVRQWLR